MSYFSCLPLFSSGELLVSESVQTRGYDYLPLVRRHLSGDWGDVDDYSSASNDQSVNEASEILSQYRVLEIGHNEEIVTIVTAADRAYTVVFLASDPG